MKKRINNNISFKNASKKAEIYLSIDILFKSWAKND